MNAWEKRFGRLYAEGGRPKLRLGSALDESGRERPAYGFEAEGAFVVDARRSPCGRFEVDPEDRYDLPRSRADELDALNDALRNPFVVRRASHEAQFRPLEGTWAFTGNRMARACQSDQMQGQDAFWRPRPFDESLHCMDAPEHIASTGRAVSGGIIVPLFRARDGHRE